MRRLLGLFRGRRPLSSHANVRNSSAEATYFDSPVVPISHAGSRVLELSRSDDGNPLSLNMLMILKDHLKGYEDIDTVGAVLFTSESDNQFSRGLDADDLVTQSSILLPELGSVCTQIVKFGKKKASISVMGGQMNGTALGLFSHASHVLMTPETRVRLDEIVAGYIPTGGLVWKLVRACPEGKAFARYMAVSQREMTGYDMFQLGLGTHLTENKPQLALCAALGDTFVPVESDTKYEQVMTVDMTALDGLLEAMHLESDLDPLSNPLWDEAILVSPNEAQAHAKELGLEDDLADDVMDEDVMDVGTIGKEVLEVFGKGSMVECLERLKQSNSLWAEEAASVASQLDQEVLKQWFDLTETAHNLPLEKCLDAERVAIEALIEKVSIE